MKNIRIYFELMRTQLLSLMEYKTDFIIAVLSETGGVIIPLALLWIIFLNVPSISGWSFPQVLFIVGLSNLSWSLYFFLFPIMMIERFVLNGELDKFLTKPVNPLLQLITSKINFEPFGGIIVGLVLIAASSFMLGLEWNVLDILLFVLFVASGVIIILSVTLIVASVAFWTTKSNALLNILFRLSNISEYPLEIYNFATVFFISFVLPFAFVNYYPAQLFIGKGIAPALAYLTPVVAIITFAVAYSVWKLGLKNYQSTGS